MAKREYASEDVSEEYADRTREDWVLAYIETYGQYDGSHHKQWVMDQVVRILKGTPVTVTRTSYSDGDSDPWENYNTGDPSKEYLAWVEEMKGEYDELNEEYEYEYDVGCPP